MGVDLIAAKNRITQRPLTIRTTGTLRALRLKLALLMLSIAQIGKSQYNTNFLNYSNTGRAVSINLDFEAGSNGLNGSLANRLLWGGYISNQVKEESSRLLRTRNNFGVSLNRSE